MRMSRSCRGQEASPARAGIDLSQETPFFGDTLLGLAGPVCTQA